MTTIRLLPALALAAVLSLPSGAVVAQDDATDTPTDAEASMMAEDPGVEELEALVPPALAGLPLAENLTLSTGEEVLADLPPEQAEILLGLLDQNGRTVADYAVATTWLQVSDSDLVVIQAHRIADVDASQTVDAWVELLLVDLEDPKAAEGIIAGRPVALVSDGSAPGVPLLHLFAAGDVMWMIVAVDQAIVAEAMDAVDADGGEEPESGPAA